jgi:hypothetical protein
MRTVLHVATVALASALTISVAESAHAGSFGQQGDWTFSAERLTGLYLFNEGGGATVLGLGAPAPGSHPYVNARFGVDAFIIDHLSLGGSLAVWSVDPDQGRSATGALVAPRVGYAFSFNDKFGFWPRGGFTYRTFGRDDSEFALTLEAMFYASPASNFAITFGPVLDLGLAGDGPEARNFGIVTAGIMGWI